MSWVDGAWHRTRVFVRGERYAREQQEEIRIHLEMEAQQHPLNGVTEARRRMGNLTGVQERLREAAGMAWLDRLSQDLTYAVRGLRRSPAFTITVVLTLALGVGANSAMFSFLDRVFFREPGGVTRPGDVRRVYLIQPNYMGPAGSMSAFQRFTYREFEAIQRSATGVDVAADIPQTWSQRADTLPQTGYVSGNYFSVLGLRPALGRFFSQEEASIDADSRVAVITYALWKRAYDLDPAVLTKKVTVRGKEFSIVGVAPKDFDGIDIAVLELILPLHHFTTGRGTPWYDDANWSPLRPLIRAPGKRAVPLMTAATIAYRDEKARATKRNDSTVTLTAGPIIAAAGPASNVKEVSLSARLAGVTLVVMLIACANVASLLLVRAARRRREIAVRLALGVSRRRLWTQLLTESMLLSAIGCAVALVVAQWAGTALRKLLLPTNIWSGPALDMRVVLFTVTTAFVVGIVTGVFPAFQATHTELNDVMKSGARSGGSRTHIARSALLMVQGALSIVLLIAAGLFIRTLGNVRSLPLGFDATRMIYASVTSDTYDSTGARVTLALNEAARRLATVPGVRATGLATHAPMAGGQTGIASIPEHPERSLSGNGNYVSADFFAATDMPFVAGRAFTREEAENQAAVVVVNQSFARRAWPNENPLGKCVRVGAKSEACSTVVGVTIDARYIQIIEGRTTLQFYAPLSASTGFQRPTTVIINADPSHAPEIVTRARAELTQLLPGNDNIFVRRSSESLAPQYRPWELGAELFSTFGLLALVVAAIGVYSVIAYSVSQRTHEMGVRVALGAQTRDVLDLIVREGMRVVTVGIAIGIAVALALGKVIESQLFGIDTRDPYVIIGATSVLTGVALAACLIPAWRAARVDPMTALRTE